MTDVLRPGDLVVVAQGVGEPTPLLEQLVRAGGSLRDTEVFVGLSHSAALTEDAARSLSLVSFGGMGPLARLAATNTVSIIPCHFADVPRLLALRAPGRLVVLMQVSPPNDDGFHSLGMAVDYTYELVGQARAVIAEVNEQLPVTSAPCLHASAFAATVRTSRPLPVIPPANVSEVHRQIAAHVVKLVPDGATIQLGIGAVPSVVGAALTRRRDLRVHSTLVGDWLLGLAEAGALSTEPGSVRISEAAGSAALYEYVTRSAVLVRPVRELNSPDVLGRLEGFVAMNSALQVDLSGQVNAEEIESGYVGGIGGQPEFLRAAQRSVGGRSIVMLPATAARGRQSRIVRRLHQGTVTTLRSGVDFVVTEFGVADLRGTSLDERPEALIAVAAPHHRDALLAVTERGDRREVDDGR
ncbi:acetyl-CoA hydrolase/transferase family protein [Modestobacter sp. DSM 44400]|uniref:acetyl-CoA hydrolase/transferase family protein n=1 Tax=Modestobacter sp. DSM 44400 TaxID=1550230 RepID=UPI000B875E1E|nr:acetyl-CoA hydrolase/transferase C-terminal domain-containing protein [Modestobacter sp. DSM 44400]